MCDTRRYGSLDGNALVGRSRYEQSSISRSRSYGLAYGCQPFEGRTHGHRVEQESGGSVGARRLRSQESFLSGPTPSKRRRTDVSPRGFSLEDSPLC
jgi:hypothetical protein